MTGAPAYGKRKDANHAELIGVIKECKQRYPRMNIRYADTSDLGGKLGDTIVQFYYDNWYSTPPERKHPEMRLLEFKSSKKKKLTKAQRENPLTLVRIDGRQDILALLGIEDWEST